MVHCKISKNKWRQRIGLQMYELKIIQFEIDLQFLEKLRWQPLYKLCPYNISTLTAILNGMLDALCFIQSH